MRRVAALALSLIIILTGCLSNQGNDPQKPPKYEKKINKNLGEDQEFKHLYPGEVTTLNYLITNSANELGLAVNLVDSLVEYDKYGRIEPSLAIDWKSTEENTVWTFKLREGVNWYSVDGYKFAEVVAQDFVDSVNYILNPDNESTTANIVYSVIKNAKEYYNGEIDDFSEVGVKAIDKYTLEYTLEKPIPYFLSMVTHPCFLPANGEFLEAVGDKFGTDNSNLLYNGAYILEIFQPQTRRVLVANDDYWDKDDVYIKKIVSIYNKEALTLAPELFLRGEVDAAKIPSTVLDAWMEDPETEKQVRPNRTNYFSYFYAFNFNPKFDKKYEPENWKIAVNNLSFRKALFHGFDRKAALLTEEPYYPENRLLNTITPKNFIDFNGLDYTELEPLADISNTNSFNKELALEYKKKARDELEGKATFPVKVLIPYNTASTEWANRSQVIEQQIENLLGKDFVDIIIEARPPTGFLSNTRRNGNYAILESNWGPDYADPETFTTPFDPEGSYNFVHMAQGYKEDNGRNIYENMVNMAKRKLYDEEKRLNLFAEAERFLIDQAFVIPYALGSGGYSSSRLNPFEAQYSPFGVSESKFKGQRIMEEPMNTEEFNKAQEKWEIERAEALKGDSP